MTGKVKRHEGRFVVLMDDAGNPPCTPPDDCDVCRLFTNQRPNETRAEWISRILRTSRYSPTGGPA